MDAYRFFISWSRILSNGKPNGGINQEGIDYQWATGKWFKTICDSFPLVSSSNLEDEYGGFLSTHIMKVFQDYAELCCKELKDRVKNWITLNEPWTYNIKGYTVGTKAPGRYSSWSNPYWNGGDSGTKR